MKILYSIFLILGFIMVIGIAAEQIKSPPSAIFTATKARFNLVDTKILL
jgi:hypothetical protein